MSLAEFAQDRFEMKLKQLMAGPDDFEIVNEKNVEITGITYDSRTVKSGNLFCAIKGQKTDGHDYIDRAISKGATALVTEKAVDNINIPQVVAASSRQALGIISHSFYGNPTKDLIVVGLTGTNGKTTTSYLIDSILTQKFGKTAVIGTLGLYHEGSLTAGSLTTPESLDLAKNFVGLKGSGVKAITMEVSSHALTLRRVEGIEFDLGVFTNISHDHLDFHGTFENYRDAKLSFFELLTKSNKKAVAVVNVDDKHFRRHMKFVSCPVTTCSTLDAKADVFCESVKLLSDSSEITITSPYGMTEVKLSLVGRLNVVNAIAAFAAGVALKFDEDEIVKGLENVKRVPGRFDRIRGKGYDVIIDYAHTPDALERLLSACRELSPTRIILVFGCGGDRDRAKRPMMGEIASKLADYVIITSDNPRSETPDTIIDEIEKGVKKGVDNVKIVSRLDAIHHALENAGLGDMVVIAGKGHENYQIIGDQTFHFDDSEVVLKKLGAKAGCN